MTERIELENRWLRATVLPGVGAKVFDLTSKETGQNYLWHNSRIAPQPFPVGAILDDYWCGGWDDAFPTCDPCEFRGKSYPGLGELRSIPWNVANVDQSKVELYTSGPISPVTARKTVRLSPGAAVLSMRFEVTNSSSLPLDFMWGTHPAIRPFGSNLKLRIPARTGIFAEGSPGVTYQSGQRFGWPMLDGHDLSQIGAADSGSYYGLGVTDLEAGWYAIEDLGTGEGIAVSFPLHLCPYLWLWLNYGGYYGHRHVIVEPWTSFPMTLAAAAGAGTSRLLEPGSTFHATILVAPYRFPETYEHALEKMKEDK
jgi:hypothetical protein